MRKTSHPTVHTLRAELRTAATSGVADAGLRRTIARLLHIAPADLREWSTRICPDCFADTVTVSICEPTGYEHLPPLYYALAPETAAGDMPLGIGVSATAALNDLLWNVKAGLLLDDVHRA